MAKLTLKSVRKRKEEAIKAKLRLFRPRKEQVKDINDFLNQYEAWTSFKPLKIGILDDISELILSSISDTSKNCIRRALSYHTANKKYLDNVASGDRRYTLTGEYGGDITDEQKEYSIERLEKIENESKNQA